MLIAPTQIKIKINVPYQYPITNHYKRILENIYLFQKMRSRFRFVGNKQKEAL